MTEVEKKTKSGDHKTRFWRFSRTKRIRVTEFKRTRSDKTNKIRDPTSQLPNFPLGPQIISASKAKQLIQPQQFPRQA